jgi:hypothetical protein
MTSYAIPRWLLPVACLLLLMLPLAGIPALASAQTAERCFAETGHCISGPIRAYWEQHGGLPVFGYPITEQRVAGYQAIGIVMAAWNVSATRSHRQWKKPSRARPILCNISSAVGWNCTRSRVGIQCAARVARARSLSDEVGWSSLNISN